MNHSPSKTRRYYLACFLARTAAFAALIAYALLAPEALLSDLTYPRGVTPLTIVWLALMVSMVLRLFPSRSESIGCQKRLAHRLVPTGKRPSKEEIRKADRGAVIAAVFWIAANALFFLAFAKGWIGRRFLVCLSGFYGVCDMFCILFFCPFQAWMMHNRCCTTCRIFDWDYLMICTPLLAVPGPLTISVCVLAAFIFLRWEATYRSHPERFFECSNDALRCANCQEHLCRYKRILAANLRRRT